MSNLREVISNSLLRIRTVRGLSQSDLARAAHLEPSAIAHFESARRMPSCENLLKLADALDVTLDELFGRKWQDRLSTPVNIAIASYVNEMETRDQQVFVKLAKFIATQKRIGTIAGCADLDTEPDAKTARRLVRKRKQT